MRRILVALAAVAAVAVVITAPASAGITSTYSLQGIETGIPVSLGGDVSSSSFAGLSFSAPYIAYWTASVEHHSLIACASDGTNCITGGSFSILAAFGGGSPVSGTFDNGSIALSSGSPVTCTTTATYSVTGVVNITGGGTAYFSATLTHYQVYLFGTCVPYFATVSGSLSPPA